MNPTKLGKAGSRTQLTWGYLLAGFTQVSLVLEPSQKKGLTWVYLNYQYQGSKAKAKFARLQIQQNNGFPKFE